MKGIFEYLNISCQTCLSGPEAIEILDNSSRANVHFDLIITDHKMPEMDGISLVKEGKKIYNGRQVPFILMLSSLEKRIFFNMKQKRLGSIVFFQNQ